MAENAVAPHGQLNTVGELAESPIDAEVPHGAATAAPTVQEAHDGKAAPGEPGGGTRTALVAGIVAVVTLAGLTGWFGWRSHQSHHANELRAQFLQVARQGAVNLTTIDFAEVDSDIQRILNSATGTFYDDFSKRSQGFVDVVKKAQSKTVGTIVEAGLESETDHDAQALVAVTVKTSTVGAEDQRPRAWRMRISVQKVADQVKVSNVEFVP